MAAPANVAEIPYSTFLAQLRAANVSQVHIVGDSIGGVFVKPVLWPPPKNEVNEAKQECSTTAFVQTAFSGRLQPSHQMSQPPARYPGFHCYLSIGRG